MKLPERLKLIINMVPNCEIVCDIGTDHAYIPINLIQNNKCKKVIAADVKNGPLVVANKNIKKACFESKIITRLSDGLIKINENEVDVLILAGMGGPLIIEILSNQLEKSKKATTIILQPMTAIEKVREWLYCNGFTIFDEKLCSEGNRIYNCICARWENINLEKDSIYYYIGEKLIEKKDILLEKLIKQKILFIEKAISRIKNLSYESEKQKKIYLEIKQEYINLLEKIINT